MIKFIRRILNIIKEGFKGIWTHRSMGLASIIATFATLLVVGTIIIISVTINNLAKEIEGQVDEVEVFIKVDSDKIDVFDLETKIENFDSPLTYFYRSSKEALEIMKETWGDDAQLLEGIASDGLLPASFVVKLEDISQADRFVDYIENHEVVDDVSYYQDLVQQAYKISRYVQIFGFALIAILMVVSLFIISNTIKLTVFSRREEIFVMRYVGATNNYVSVPFMIEGLFFGLIGSGLAFLAIYFGYKYAYSYLTLYFLDGLSMMTLLRPIVYRDSLLQIFLALGTGIGVIGSIFSTRKYLRV